MHRRTILAVATTVGITAGFAQAAAASPSTPARGKIGHSAPSPNARAAIRALGLDDGEGSDSSDDGVGSLGRVAHGSITAALPTAGAAARIRSLGADD